MTINKIASVAAIAMLCASAATTATAATVTKTFNFSGNGGLEDSYKFTAGDLALEATGHLLNGDGSIGSQEKIGQYSGGFGVTNNDELATVCTSYNYFFQWCNGFGTVSTDSHLIDNHGQDEVVKLSFNTDVTVKKIFFSYTNWYDDFSFSVFDDEGKLTSFDGRIDIVGNGYGSFTFAAGEALTASMFGIGAFTSNYFDVDGFKLRGIKVKYNDDDFNEPEPVPLPAAGFLLLGALGGLSVMRKKAKKAA